MRRSDRLFQLIQILRDGRRHTAAEMAGRMAVSTRTLWRDMEILAASGVPVEGARGQGYRMTAPIALPPLTLTPTELEALHLGLAVVREGADPDLQDAARSLSGKLGATQPGTRPAPAEGWGLAAHPFAEAAAGFAHMPAIRAAIRDRTKLRLAHDAPGRDPSERTVRPLQMDYWGRLWTLTAWCELREDFRMFRVDRITGLAPTGEPFEDEPGRRMADYLARYVEGADGN